MLDIAHESKQGASKMWGLISGTLKTENSVVRYKYMIIFQLVSCKIPPIVYIAALQRNSWASIIMFQITEWVESKGVSFILMRSSYDILLRGQRVSIHRSSKSLNDNKITDVVVASVVVIVVILILYVYVHRRRYHHTMSQTGDWICGT